MAFVLAVTTVTLPAFAWLASQLVSSPVLRGGILAAGVAPAEVASVALTGLAGSQAAQRRDCWSPRRCSRSCSPGRSSVSSARIP
jgi:hypothetical protein